MKIILKYFFLFLNVKKCSKYMCDPSPEPSEVMMDHNICFYEKVGKIFPLLSLFNLLIWSSLKPTLVLSLELLGIMFI